MARQWHNSPILVFSMLIFLMFSTIYSAPGYTQVRANNAQVMTQLVGGDIKSGENFIVMIQFKNTGTSTWSKRSGFHLAIANKEDWGITRVDLPDKARIAPGETANFRFTATAPIKSGKQSFQWQMRQWSTFFGSPSENTQVQIIGYGGVPNNSEFIYQKVPTIMKSNLSYSVTLHFKNTGRAVWMPGQYHLSPINSASAMDWMIDQVELKNITRQGEFYTFRFDVQAPSEPGSYNFSWQLQHNATGRFGDTNKKLVIKVTP